MNKLIIVGNLTRDPEKRLTQTGRAVCNFTVAVSRRSQGDHPEADYFRVTVWDQAADNCAKYLTKGRKVAVDGEVHMEHYTDRDNVVRYSLVVTGARVEFLTPREKDDKTEDGPAPQEQAGNFEPVEDEDLPF